MSEATHARGIWNGEWVARRLDIELISVPGAAVQLADLVGMGVRRNPRRAHLLVSSVLGKHIPADPDVVHDAGLRLGHKVAAKLAGERCGLVLGFAETATALAGSVASALDADCLHSTRRRVAGVTPVGGFEEEHSHATSHLLLPVDPDLLRRPEPLVLVDDELSTGRTALNTIAALQCVFARERYVIAALVDLRSPEDVQRCVSTARDLGVRIDVVSLAAGTVRLPDDILTRGAALVSEIEASVPARPLIHSSVAPQRIDVGWPAHLPESARHGLTASARAQLDSLSSDFGRRIGEALAAGGVRPDGRVLVLGTEELMEAPLRLARALKAVPESPEVFFSTTTRSPVLAVDDPGYAIRTPLTFAAHDVGDAAEQRFAYNVVSTRAGEAWDAVVVVVDAVGDTPVLSGAGGLLEAVATATHQVFLVALPTVIPTNVLTA